ncbi:hypothetical protein TNCV_4895591 [Trichonephila clavipes]|nr:hypothetical protein TNCV_4895591 [Trichonephila clavipes]
MKQYPPESIAVTDSVGDGSRHANSSDGCSNPDSRRILQPCDAMSSQGIRREKRNCHSGEYETDRSFCCLLHNHLILTTANRKQSISASAIWFSCSLTHFRSKCTPTQDLIEANYVKWSSSEGAYTS